jgi:hypothetical protein
LQLTFNFYPTSWQKMSHLWCKKTLQKLPKHFFKFETYQASTTNANSQIVMCFFSIPFVLPLVGVVYSTTCQLDSFFSFIINQCGTSTWKTYNWHNNTWKHGYKWQKMCFQQSLGLSQTLKGCIGCIVGFNKFSLWLQPIFTKSIRHGTCQSTYHCKVINLGLFTHTWIQCEKTNV